MTNNQHGQVPAIQRYKIGYHSDEWGVRSSTPSGIKDQAGPWVRYEDHIAALCRLHTENEALRAGYDAARLEIESLREREQLARDVNSRRVTELEAKLGRWGGWR